MTPTCEKPHDLCRFGQQNCVLERSLQSAGILVDIQVYWITGLRVWRSLEENDFTNKAAWPTFSLEQMASISYMYHIFLQHNNATEYVDDEFLLCGE